MILFVIAFFIINFTFENNNDNCGRNGGNGKAKVFVQGLMSCTRAQLFETVEDWLRSHNSAEWFRLRALYASGAQMLIGVDNPTLFPALPIAVRECVAQQVCCACNVAFFSIFQIAHAPLLTRARRTKKITWSIDAALEEMSFTPNTVMLNVTNSAVTREVRSAPARRHFLTGAQV